MTLKEVLAALGERLGVGAIELDRERGCRLAFDETLTVDIDEADDGQGVYLSATVAPAPREGREAVFAELLEANLAGRGSGRACLALDGDLDEIVLVRHIEPDHLEVALLESALEDFLGVLEAWRRRHEAGELGSLRAGEAAPAPASTERGAGGMIRV